jgi:transcription initiation factor TFIID TATA-box-binding protein
VEAFVVVKIAIINVVATAALNQRIDFNKLTKLREILYDPKIYSGRVAYFKSHNMRGKVSIFASGKMISIGTKSEEEAVRELEYVKDFLVKKDLIKPTILSQKIRNIVLMVNFEKIIDLEELARNYEVIYEPEQFPGGILRFKEAHQATVLLFASGKAIVTGLKSSDQIEPVIQKLINVLKCSNLDFAK